MMFTKNKKVSTMSKRYTAFTLAEVLLTLLIIGVVASMTIPNLMNSINDMEFKAQYKKLYSFFSSVNADYRMNNKCYVTMPTNFDANGFWDDFKQYAAKYCQSGDFANACWYKNNNYRSNIKQLNGLPMSYPDLSLIGSMGSIALKDGTYIAYTGTSEGGAAYSSRVFVVDLNGHKKPNMLGKDVHIFKLHYRSSVSSTYNYFEAAERGSSLSYLKAKCKNNDTSAANSGSTCGILWLHNEDN